MRRFWVAAKNRIVFSMILPVFLVGLAISALSVYLGTKPVISFIVGRADAELRLATDLGMEVCNERLDYLLSLRLENDPEMVASLKKEALNGVLEISRRLDHVQMIVVENDGTVVGSSENPVDWVPHILEKRKSRILAHNVKGEQVRLHYQYFPFWRWHIISLIHEHDYMGPVRLAKSAIRVVTLSVFLLVTAMVVILFNKMVNQPLKRIIKAAEGVAQGRYTRLDLKRDDEVGQVAQAFDSMVASLEEDKNWINSILSKLKESEERYRLLTESSLANIIMVQDGLFIYANRATLATLGYSAEELYRTDILDLVHPDDRELVRRKMVGRTEEDQRPDYYEFRYVTKQGRTRWLEMLTAPSLYKGKTVTLGHAIDITDKKIAKQEQKLLQEKLQHAQKLEALGTIVGTVAHDLNNILAGVVGYPDLLLLQVPEGSPLRKYITAIQQSGRKAAAVVQDLLTMVRRGVVVKEIVSLNGIVSDYLKSPEFEKLKSLHSDVSFQTDLSPELLNTSGSRIHLLKTLMNLVSNSAEASPQGGLTRIRTENRYIDSSTSGYDGNIEEGEYVVLSVSDTGVGIAQQDLARIFEPFYTRKVMGGNGTGLGMAVVWSTVKDHQGHIRVDTEEGRGTKFDLYFPATRDNPPLGIDRVPLETLRGAETILVVDDVREQRELAGEMLSGLGYKVNLAASGEEAVECVKTSPPDLLVLDMIMDPGIDGLDTYRKIIDLRPGQKAIIASGFSETERVRETQRLGASTCIIKPYTLDKLAAAVRNELDRARLS